MKNVRRTICCALLAFLLLAQVMPVSATPPAMDNMDSEMDVVRPILNETSVMQTVTTYFRSRQTFLSGGSVADLLGAIPGVVRGEEEHLQMLQNEELTFVSSVIVFDEIFCEKEYADVHVTETVTFQKNGVTFTETVAHSIFACFDDDWHLVIASDGYAETYSGFKSHAYVEPCEAAAAELQHTYGGAYCMTYIANGEIGTAETGTNVTKYGTWIGNYDDWCATFVSWCANQCSIPESVIPRTQSCNTMRDHFEDLNRFYYSEAYGGTVRPSPGDIFVEGTSSSSARHVGIVVSVSGNTMYVVDGNCENKANYHAISLSDDGLVGFMRPSYAPGHTLGSWEYDANYHWKECSHCGYCNTSAHTLKMVGGAYTCSTCGYHSNATINSTSFERSGGCLLDEVA